MVRRTPQQSRTLGLWTAAWLFALLLVLLLWLGDVALQWPVLLVPVLWALVAMRPRRRGQGPQRRPVDPASRYDRYDAVEPPVRRLPPTRELPRPPEVPRDGREK
jgi:hypothetical protein